MDEDFTMHPFATMAPAVAAEVHALKPSDPTTEPCYYVTRGAARPVARTGAGSPERGILAVPARLVTVRGGALWLAVDAVRVAGASNPLHARSECAGEALPFAVAGEWAYTLADAHALVRAAAERHVKKLTKQLRAAERIASGEVVPPVLAVAAVDA